VWCWGRACQLTPPYAHSVLRDTVAKRKESLPKLQAELQELEDKEKKQVGLNWLGIASAPCRWRVLCVGPLRVLTGPTCVCVLVCWGVCSSSRRSRRRERRRGWVYAMPSPVT
jgi:hypothetical protein